MLSAAAAIRRARRGLRVNEHFVAMRACVVHAVGSAGLLGVASVARVVLTDRVAFLVTHGLALAAGVTLYVAASNLVPEFQGKRGWGLPLAFFAVAGVFYLTKVVLDRAL